MGEVRVINTIQEMAKQGLSLRKICKFLDTIGAPTKCRGKSWHPEMINRILAATSS